MTRKIDQRNLVRELEDKERRKAYLHPGKKRLLPTLWRMYKPVRQSPRILAACVGYALSNGVLPLLGVLVTYVLVGLLSSSAANPQTMFMAAGIYALAFFLCSALSNQLNNRNYTWFTWLRLDYLNRINAKLMTMDLGLFENSAFMDDVQTGFYSLNGNNDGLEGYYHKIFESGGTLVSVLLLSALLALQSPLILLASLAVIVIGLAAKTHLVKLRYRHQEDFIATGAGCACWAARPLTSRPVRTCACTTWPGTSKKCLSRCLMPTCACTV